MRPLAIVFDFDGVLADTERLHMQAFQRVLEEIGIDLTEEEYYARYLGYDDVSAIARVDEDRTIGLSSDGQASLLTRKAALMPDLLGGAGVLYPGAPDCVRRLAAEVPLAIASGALRREIELVLEAAGLGRFFQGIVAAGETVRSKPAPDPYVHAVGLLAERGLVPRHESARRHVVAIEDSRWGIASAKAAGLRCVALTTSYPASQLAGADLVVGTLDEIDIASLSALLDVHA